MKEKRSDKTADELIIEGIQMANVDQSKTVQLTKPSREEVLKSETESITGKMYK